MYVTINRGQSCKTFVQIHRHPRIKSTIYIFHSMVTKGFDQAFVKHFLLIRTLLTIFEKSDLSVSGTKSLSSPPLRSPQYLVAKF